jgi:hypothetical protein
MTRPDGVSDHDLFQTYPAWKDYDIQQNDLPEATIRNRLPDSTLAIQTAEKASIAQTSADTLQLEEHVQDNAGGSSACSAYIPHQGKSIPSTESRQDSPILTGFICTVFCG